MAKEKAIREHNQLLKPNDQYGTHGTGNNKDDGDSFLRIIKIWL